jgi:hypothetical protein
MGYEFDWTKKERAGDVIYTITIKDETIDQFEKLLLENDNNSFHIDHNGVYHLSIDYEQANIEILESLGISDAANINKILSMTTNFTVEIETGKIIDSNADQIMGRTAIWHNPQQLEITFKPKARINILVCLVPLLLLVFVGAGIFLIKSGKARCPSCGTKNSKNSYTCKNCGADLNYGEESGSFVDYFNED